MAAGAHLNESPYCATDSNPFFQTRVTSQAFVAESLHDKKAETELPPTAMTLVSCWSPILRSCRNNKEAGVVTMMIERVRPASATFPSMYSTGIFAELEKWRPGRRSQRKPAGVEKNLASTADGLDRGLPWTNLTRCATEEWTVPWSKTLCAP